MFGFGFLLKTLRVITLLTYMDRLLPLEGGTDDDLRVRSDLAWGIVEATDDPDEQALLVRIARWESFFIPKVIWCQKNSPVGARGAFQVIPRSKEESTGICTDPIFSAQRALHRIAESKHLCKHLPKREQLAQYATGNCGELGKRMSRLRYATADDLYK